MVWLTINICLTCYNTLKTNQDIALSTIYGLPRSTGRPSSIRSDYFYYYYYYFSFPPLFWSPIYSSNHNISKRYLAHDIGQTKAIRSWGPRPEPHPITELSPFLWKTFLSTFLRNGKVYKPETFCALFIDSRRNFVTFESKGSDDTL